MFRVDSLSLGFREFHSKLSSGSLVFGSEFGCSLVFQIQRVRFMFKLSGMNATCFLDLKWVVLLRET